MAVTLRAEGPKGPAAFEDGRILRLLARARGYLAAAFFTSATALGLSLYASR